jgi:Asp-tRNA(Asn)/Glu-tRNA(Gln) amidotransferase A subunit family amidase
VPLAGACQMMVPHAAGPISTGNAAISIPCGWANDGLPVGLQLM